MTINKTKTHILNTSIGLFSARGYKETSIREISKEAGVNVSMISYYFGGKDGILENITKNLIKGFTLLLDQIEFTDITVTMGVLKKFLEYLEDNRPQIKIIFSEMGKGSDCFIPVKEKIIELQTKLGELINVDNNSINNSELSCKLKVLTDILLGMIFSDYIFDFSGLNDSITKKEKSLWQEERRQMLLNILTQLSGLNTGKLSFESII
ncbi:MAG: hypothetical protein DRP59_01430 [Spirochaetes bacterium]|nr:MAG: hypothetical protein DRP59_01430 [Spirochaetota bacterium]